MCKKIAKWYNSLKNSIVRKLLGLEGLSTRIEENESFFYYKNNCFGGLMGHLQLVQI